MKQVHVFISGNVQGVGYRQFVKSTAKQYGLTGWVRNTEDGGVEAVFQGEEKTMLECIELCRTGPFLSEVKQLGFDWEDGEALAEFLIKSD